jgi:hypothetical protein
VGSHDVVKSVKGPPRKGGSGPVGSIAPEGSREAVKARANPEEQKQLRLAELEEEMARLRGEEPAENRSN